MTFWITLQSEPRTTTYLAKQRASKPYSINQCQWCRPREWPCTGAQSRHAIKNRWLTLRPVCMKMPILRLLDTQRTLAAIMCRMPQSLQVVPLVAIPISAWCHRCILPTTTLSSRTITTSANLTKAAYQLGAWPSKTKNSNSSLICAAIFITIFHSWRIRLKTRNRRCWFLQCPQLSRERRLLRK